MEGGAAEWDALLENDENASSQQSDMWATGGAQVYCFPPLPSCEVTGPHDDLTLPRLVEALQERQRVRQMMLDEYNAAADTVRSMLEQLGSDFASKEKTIEEQNSKLAENDVVLEDNKANIESLENKIKVQDQKIDSLQKNNEACEDVKRSLQRELETRERRLREELWERRREEQHLRRAIEENKREWEEECARRVQNVQEEMQKCLSVKEQKLKQVKAIVMENRILDSPPLSPHPCQPPCSFSPDVLYEESPASSLLLWMEYKTTSEDSDSCPRQSCPVPSSSSSSSGSNILLSEASACASEGEDVLRAPPSSPTPPRKDTPASSQRSRRRAGCWTPQRDGAKPPPDRSPAAPEGHCEVPVRPLHRRCCPSGQERWVDHRPPSSLDLGTMMRPVIPNALEMSSPSEKTLSKGDKYVLTHQEVASDDEIRTKLIKGEVIKTRGGGQAVQFTDIETLRQELVPVSRKGGGRFQ